MYVIRYCVCGTIHDCRWGCVLVLLDEPNCPNTICDSVFSFAKDAYNKGKINDGDLNLAVGRLFAYRYDQCSQASVYTHVTSAAYATF